MSFDVTDSEDLDALAGEYVLGTLDADERAAAEARRIVDARLNQAIAAWELRLAPLNDLVPEVEPAADLLTRIHRKIDASSTPADNVVNLNRSRNRWRAAALASSALAAGLALAFVVQKSFVGSAPEKFVALLQKDPTSPGFVVEVDLVRHELSFRPVAAKAVPGKSYELWMIHDKIGAPKPLGITADGGTLLRPVLTAADIEAAPTATFAVTLEPEGGAPDGRPSAAPIWTGTLVRTNF